MTIEIIILVKYYIWKRFLLCVFNITFPLKSIHKYAMHAYYKPFSKQYYKLKEGSIPSRKKKENKNSCSQIGSKISAVSMEDILKFTDVWDWIFTRFASLKNHFLTSLRLWCF